VALSIVFLGISGTAIRSELDATAVQYYARLTEMAPIVGRDSAVDYYQRLAYDGGLIDSADVPHDYTAEQWQQLLNRMSELDLSLAKQLLSGDYRPMKAIRGLGETFVKSSRDGTMQPVAVYVPPSYSPDNPAPLVVFLHGNPQSETQLLAPKYVADLADETGSILVAPYGRGYYDFRGSISDVYDALDAATSAFRIDPRRKYLAGYSMGGFSVFEVAPVHPDPWAAVMCISGALLGHDAHSVLSMLSSKPFYVLTGSADDSIPTQYPTATAVFLRNSGMAVSFYSLTGGVHRMITLLPVLSQAWNDMHHGVIRTPPPMLGGMALPSAPVGMTKP
jgi:dienelactone hydrolase